MQPLSRMPPELGRAVRFLLTDVDDTLTHNRRLDARTYDALERLQAAGIKVIPVTAAPAGWCDGMARMWPVDAVIAENGGLYFLPDRQSGAMHHGCWLEEEERRACMERLAALGARVVAQVPGAGLAADQPYRETTLALSFVDAAARHQGVKQALALLREAGARATMNSLWALSWFGDFDKLAMSRRLLLDGFGTHIEAARDAIFYVGDSINDEPMFGFFPHTAGVATLRDIADEMRSLPRWIADGPGGAGFVEVADALLRGR